MADYRTEFPDFAPETMPALPEGWADTSWHNDQCPYFERQLAPETMLRLFVNYADRELREFPDGERFDAWLSTPQGNCPENISSDDLAKVLTWADDVAKRLPEILAKFP